ncbi:PqqD family protein [Paenibacillus thiaminolyticus]|uniref:PqqD family protein n=1 Tax=Paenibacillus thiaminolyticus TaxID=49283 RepID=UPI0013F68B05|nr:PqqD family protein [Paenibacillus thiaminolyticus]NGP57607.1 PqqD family protein [Paenibacillus thiaminolyticus]
MTNDLLLSKPVRSDDVQHFPTGEYVCLHNLETGEYYTLNEVAAFIWSNMDGILSIRELIDLVCDKYEIDVLTIEQDILLLIQDLKAAETIHIQ